ncbi:hypothetical protein [Streptomyces sp. SID13031]|uniref:hypothetical protein n=1 Tax=Streptomyces sp. SID13031 TaxID=2706046 RepID=UPI0013C69F0D|nr:hypothetical protein [Streptomyces sp. SID13031]NEA37357.1 hypothetical protein [Streptomyces sp. SID13031]
MDLSLLFKLVAILELAYALTGLLPPEILSSVTGWRLSADGQWVTKLLAVALAAQAWVAWTLRRQPHVGVAKGLAFYQIGSATADWVMWLVLADNDVFSTPMAKALVIFAIPTHYLLGFLIIAATRTPAARHSMT